MRPAVLAAAWLAGATFWAGCATVPRPALSPDEEAIRAGMQRYAALVRTTDNQGIAALFTPDGAIGFPGREPISGREAILAYLERFAGYHVESEEITTDSFDVHGADGHVTGRYRQRVRTPSGGTQEVHGAYAADWRREPDGNWYISFMTTRAEK
jgi:uncharacterized protein (TIGR02246 family)